ncbi:MAG: hypothetical protein WDW38_007060 [Sanguina aurantia]
MLSKFSAAQSAKTAVRAANGGEGSKLAVQRRAQSGSPQPVTSNSNEVIDTVAKACAYGDFERLRQFVEEDEACVNKPDDNGYYPLQWAALNNHVAEANFLLSRGAAVNSTDHTGQTALHWSSVRGSLPVVETLLRHNADYEQRDNRGYTAAHVAAQYGQTSVLYHLALKWAVDVDTQDSDGRTPLHWAAYKGYADTIRLLVVLDARYSLPDREGCTPLHWAAIKGHGEACTVLLQGGSNSVLSAKDVTGATPVQLATDKGHLRLGQHLKDMRSKADKAATGCCGRNGPLSWLTATQLKPPIAKLVPITSAIGLVYLYRTTVADPGFIPTGWDTSAIGKRDGNAANAGSTKTPSPASQGHFGGSHHSHHHSNGGGGASVTHKAGISDPEMGDGSGAVSSGSSSMAGGGSGGGSSSVSRVGNGVSLSTGPPAKPHPSAQHKHLDSPALWAGNWNQLCVSCRIVRPLRAKHDSVTDRCIEVFDHFCPWVGNAIGKGNRHLFVSFLWIELYAQTVSALLGCLQVQRHINGDLWAVGDLVSLVVFVVVDVFVGISVAALAISQASQLGRNVTTNELTNWHRYKYLQASDGGYTNPFNKGCRDNCWEAFHPERAAMAPVFFAAGGGSTSKTCCGGSH